MDEEQREQPTETEWMVVQLRDQAYRLTFRLYAARATLSCEVHTPQGWQERYGTAVGENEVRWARGMNFVYQHAYGHNREPSVLGLPVRLDETMPHNEVQIGPLRVVNLGE